MEQLASNVAKLIRRVGIAAAAGVAVATALCVLFPQARLVIISLVAVAFVVKCARDTYLCSWCVSIDPDGIWICSGVCSPPPQLPGDKQDNEKGAVGNWRKYGVRWEELARVEKIQWGTREILIALGARPRKVNIGYEEIWTSVSLYLAFSAALRRWLTFSSDLLLQSRTDGTTLLLPWAALDRREHQQLRECLLALEWYLREQHLREVCRISSAARKRCPSVVRYWLGPEDSRSESEVAKASITRKKHLDWAEQMTLQAGTHRVQSQWQPAREAYAKALEVYREEGVMDVVCSCMESLAWCCVRLSRFQEARQLYEKVIALSEGIGHPTVQAIGHDGLAEIFMRTRGPLGRQEALEHLDKAEMLFRAKGRDRQAGETWGNMGLVYQSLAHLRNRLPDDSWWQQCRLEEHVEKLRKTGLALNQDRSWLDLALACHQKARELIQAVNERCPTPKGLIMEANQNGCIADIHRQKGEFEQALRFYEMSKSRCDRARSLPDIKKTPWDDFGDPVIVQDLSGWGLTLLAVALDHDNAILRRDVLDQAMRKLTDAVTVARGEGDRVDLVLSYSHRAQALKRIGHLQGACRDLEQAVETLEKIRTTAGSLLSRAMLFHEHMDVYGDLIEILIELHVREPGYGWATRAFEYCERAKCRALLEHYLDASQEREIHLPEEISEERMHAAMSTVSDIEAGRSEEELEGIAGGASAPRKSPEEIWDSIGLPFAPTASLLSCDELRKRCIAPGTLVLEMFSRDSPRDNGRESLLVVLPVTREGVGEPVVYHGTDAKELLEAAKNLRQHVGSAFHPEKPGCPVPFPFGTTFKQGKDGKIIVNKIAEFDLVKSGARDLYAALIGSPQVRRILREDDAIEVDSSPDARGDISRILFIPHGRFLNDLPFSALHDGQSFLVEKYEVAMCPSLQWQASSLRTSQDGRRTELDCLGLMSPELKGGADLIFSKMGIKPVEGASVGSQIDPARKALLSRTSSARWIVIVAHGSQWPSPQLHLAAEDKSGKSPNSGDTKKFLKNGDVSLPDIYAKAHLNCDILALLVCFAQQQAIPLGGEWQSMAAAFLAKGARSVLTAPHALHVTTTGMLLSEVFSAMAVGESSAAALKRAQCAFIRAKAGDEMEVYRHPYYWALSLIGGAERGDRQALIESHHG